MHLDEVTVSADAIDPNLMRGSRLLKWVYCANLVAALVVTLEQSLDDPLPHFDLWHYGLLATIALSMLAALRIAIVIRRSDALEVRAQFRFIRVGRLLAICTMYIGLAAAIVFFAGKSTWYQERLVVGLLTVFKPLIVDFTSTQLWLSSHIDLLDYLGIFGVLLFEVVGFLGASFGKSRMKRARAWATALKSDPLRLGLGVLIVFTVYLLVTVAPPGFCKEQQRFLSDDEFLEAAVGVEISSGWIGIERSDAAIHNFLAIHSDCCRVVREGAKDLGVGVDYVVVRMKFPVEAASPRYSVGEAYHESVRVFDACGKRID